MISHSSASIDNGLACKSLAIILLTTKDLILLNKHNSYMALKFMLRNLLTPTTQIKKFMMQWLVSRTAKAYLILLTFFVSLTNLIYHLKAVVMSFH
jgi:recombinational DNA repair protein RecR